MAQLRINLTLPGFGRTKVVQAPAPPPPPPNPPAPPVQANAAADAARTVAPEAASITAGRRSVGMAAGSYGGGIVRNVGGARGTTSVTTAQRGLRPYAPPKQAPRDTTGGLAQTALKALTGM